MKVFTFIVAIAGTAAALTSTAAANDESKKNLETVKQVVASAEKMGVKSGAVGESKAKESSDAVVMKEEREKEMKMESMKRDKMKESREHESHHEDDHEEHQHDNIHEVHHEEHEEHQHDDIHLDHHEEHEIHEETNKNSNHDADHRPRLLITIKKRHPHVYLELLRIKETVMVDRHGHPISKSATAMEELYRVGHHGQRRRLHARLFLFKPKHYGGLDGGFGAQGVDGAAADDWVDRTAAALRLDLFWPRLFFSLLSGFTIVAVVFFLGQLVFWSFGGYAEEDEDDDRATGRGLLKVPTSEKMAEVNNV
jgi:hypothetical protein